MAKGSLTVKFYLYDKVKPTHRGYPIYTRITYQRKKSRFATGEYCKEDNWNAELSRPIRDPRTKEWLLFAEGKIFDIKRQLDLNEQVVSAAIVRDIFLGKGAKEEKVKLSEYLNQFISHITTLSDDYTEGTLKHYATMKRHLTKFLDKVGKSDIALEEFDISLIEQFDQYLVTTKSKQHGKPMGRNSANNNHKKIKTVLNDAVKKDIINKSPYINFPLKNKRTTREHLTIEELNKLIALDLSKNDALDRTRDIFLWSCYTGQRYSDAQNLKSENIVEDKEGNHWITFNQIKTDDRVNVPLINNAVKIYEKHALLREVTGSVIPKMVNQNVNSYLKVLADLAEINKELTHHIARHTYATTILLDNDVEMSMVQNFLGHKSIKTTQKYAKITQNKKLSIIDKLNKKL